ncbi:MAG: outer membrane beta-barrel protein [Xanthomonadales bacterium]|nr:porin family protein [Xanthomonadales bacterium]NIX11707.1 outer membrane beta-barrel protein [Xanthomonadales bacterium]
MKAQSNCLSAGRFTGPGLFVFGMMLATPVSANGQYFAFLNVGGADTGFTTTVETVTDDDRSFELGFGYAFNRYLSVQGSYHDFGTHTGLVAQCPPELVCIAPNIHGGFLERVSFDGLSVSLRGTIPLSDKLALFGTLGIISWDASAPHMDVSGEDLVYSAGLAWEVSDDWGLQISYEEVDLDIQSGKFGVIYRF